MSTKARSVVQVANETYKMESFALPTIAKDEALLRIERCGICGTDAEEYEHSSSGYPVIPGHEPLGIVEQIGSVASERWQVELGDRIVVESTLPCRACRMCLAGDYTSCPNKFNYGMRKTSVEPALWGGFSEYLFIHPNSSVHKISKDVPLDVAILYNSLAGGIGWTVDVGGTQLGDTVLVMGCGQRGLACVVAAKAIGASKIIVTGLSVDEHKLTVAQKLGASHVINIDEENVVQRVFDITGGEGVDRVIDVAPHASNTIAQAIEVVRLGGRIVLAGHKASGPIEGLVPNMIVEKNITIRGVRGKSAAAFRQAIAIIESGGLPSGLLHTHTFSLEDAGDAIRVLRGEVVGEYPIGISLTTDY